MEKPAVQRGGTSKKRELFRPPERYTQADTLPGPWAGGNNKEDQLPMKRLISLAAAALLALSLTACGGSAAGESGQVDLAAYCDSVAEKLGWDDNYMEDMPEEMLDTYYPGLRELGTKQFIARAPAMSAVVNEMVLLECDTPEDAQAASRILQARKDEQASGGAWYPESIEEWKEAQVSVNGNYAALLAAGPDQRTVTDMYNALFAS